jgi:hypothetical protein
MARPSRRLYLESLRRMTPEQRLLMAFELTDLSRAVFRAGLRVRFPEASDAELRQVYMQ